MYSKLGKTTYMLIFLIKISLFFSLYMLSIYNIQVNFEVNSNNEDYYFL